MIRIRRLWRERQGTEPSHATAASWMKRCRNALDESPASLDELLEQDRLPPPVIWGTKSSDQDVNDQQLSSVRKSASAVLSIASAMASLEKAQQVDLEAAARHWREAGVLLPARQSGARLPAADVDHKLPIFFSQFLGGHGDNAAAGFTALIGMALTAGALPEVIATTRQHVSLSGESAPSAELSMALLAGGPHGLHPDPTRMAFAHAEPAWTEQLEAIWLRSTLYDTESAVVWALMTEAGPVTCLSADVPAPQFERALDDLSTDGSRSLLRRVDSTRAALSRKLVPRNLCRGLGPITAGLAAIVVALLLVAVHLYGERDAADRARTAASLAARSETLAASDPGMAAELAATAYKIAPDSATANAALNVEQQNQFVTRRITPYVGGIASIAASSDGSTAFVSGDDDTVGAWNVASGKLLGKTKLASRVSMLAADPSSNLVAGVTDSGNLMLWRAGPQTMLSPVETVAHALPGPIELAFFERGQRIVELASDGSVEIWDTAARTSLASTSIGLMLPHGSYPQDYQVAAASGLETSEVQGVAGEIYVVTTTRLLVRLDLAAVKAAFLLGGTQLPYAISALTADPNNPQHLAFGTTDGIEQLALDGSSGPIWTAVGSTAGIANALVYNGLDLAIASNDGTTLIATEGTDGQQAAIDSKPQGGPAVGLASNGQGGPLIAATSDGSLEIFVTGRRRATLPSLGGSTVLAFAVNGDMLLANSTVGGCTRSANCSASMYITRPEPGSAQPFSAAATRQLVPAASWWTAGSTFFANSAALSREFAVVGGQDPSGFSAVILVWDARNGVPLHDLAFPHDKQLVQLPSDAPNLVTSVQLDEQENLLIARDSYGQVAAWSTHTWSLVYNIETGTQGGVLELSPDGTEVAATLLSAGGSTTAVTKGTVGIFDVHRHVVSNVSVDGLPIRIAFDPVSSVLAVLTQQGQVHFLDRAGHPKSDAPTITLPTTGSQLRYSPDGRFIAIALDNGEVRIFDSSNGALAYAPFTAPGQSITDIAWDPAAGILAGLASQYDASGDISVAKTVLWQTDPTGWVNDLCSLADAPLSPTQWSQYVGGAFGYAPACVGS